MMKKYFLILSCICLTATFSFSQLRLPALISDGMVLQRNTELKIWGWSSPAEKVKVSFDMNVYETTAEPDGRWEVKIPPHLFGGPFPLFIYGAKDTIEFYSVFVGDVWLCSGQSNMETTMKRVEPLYRNEIPKIDNLLIRYFNVPDRYDFKEARTDFSGGDWVPADQEYILNFSAVAYFFADEMYKNHMVPVGIINAALGGSPAEAWISEEALKTFPVYYDEMQKFKDDSLIKKIQNSDRARSNAWYTELESKDAGLNSDENWHSIDLNTSDWKEMDVPGYWADTETGAVNGAVWFRREFEVPEALAGKSARLNVGRIIDADSTFINNVFVGNVTYQYPPRRYEVPENVLKAGKNIITVRVVSNIGKGGFVLDKPYDLTVGNEVIDLKGKWKYKVGAVMKPLQGETFIRWKPGGLYNGMISPLLDFKIKGVCWYQGESNADRPQEYNKLLTTLINDWRSNFNQGNIPFLIIQLPNYMEVKDQPAESNWALLREAQLKALDVPNTALIVTIDIGEWNDIHPLNKKDVGKRLALAADKLAYNSINEFSGPIYKSMEIKGNKIEISFSHTGTGLLAKGGELKEFAIAGKNKKFIRAKAEIEGNKVIVCSDKVLNPVAVRYAWADNPEGANLYNKEGLPASPFRTDEW